MEINFFSISRGIRQGCPLPALLFIIIAEILAIKIHTSPNINGIRVPYNSEIDHIKISQLADVTTLFLQNSDEISYVLEIIEEFGIFSGLKLNKNKTEGLWIGKSKQNKHNVGDINFTNKCVKALEFTLVMTVTHALN